MNGSDGSAAALSQNVLHTVQKEQMIAELIPDDGRMQLYIKRKVGEFCEAIGMMPLATYVAIYFSPGVIPSCMIPPLFVTEIFRAKPTGTHQRKFMQEGFARLTKETHTLAISQYDIAVSVSIVGTERKMGNEPPMHLRRRQCAELAVALLVCDMFKLIERERDVEDLRKRDPELAELLTRSLIVEKGVFPD